MSKVKKSLVGDISYDWDLKYVDGSCNIHVQHNLIFKPKRKTETDFVKVRITIEEL